MKKRSSAGHVRAGLVAAALGLTLGAVPGVSWAGGDWTDAAQWRLSETPAEGSAAHTAGGSGGRRAALGAGAVMVAQAGTGPAAGSPDGWRFAVSPYMWMPRIESDVTVGPLSQSTTIDFSDIVENLDFGFLAHFEATRGNWTALLDLLYMKVGNSETRNGVSLSLDIEQVMFEFGGTYRLAAVPVGPAGQITFEALGGGRFIWLDTTLGAPNQKASRDASLIDPMIGGRIVYHINDAISLWFRGDVAGFGISDNQTQLTYNLIAGLNWQFTRAASVLAGWRYMHIDVEKDGGANALNVDLSMNGPFVGFSLYF